VKGKTLAKSAGMAKYIIPAPALAKAKLWNADG
jgi:hypothetical protein